MEEEPAPPIVRPRAPDSPQATILREYIATNYVILLHAFAYKIWRRAIPCEVSVRETALEILSQVTIEALDHADRFDLVRAPFPWLLRIGVNVIKQHEAKVRSRSRYHFSPSRVIASEESPDGFIFDMFPGLAASSHEGDVAERDLLERTMAQLPEEDQRVLSLLKWCGLDYETISSRLGVSRGAARVRVYRARCRFKDTLREERERGD